MRWPQSLEDTREKHAVGRVIARPLYRSFGKFTRRKPEDLPT